MSDKLLDFVVELGQNQKLLKAFKTFKEKTMTDFGVTADDQKLVLEENVAALSARFGQAGRSIIFTFHSPSE